MGLVVQEVVVADVTSASSNSNRSAVPSSESGIAIGGDMCVGGGVDHSRYRTAAGNPPPRNPAYLFHSSNTSLCATSNCRQAVH